MLEKNWQKGLIADHEYLIVHDLLHKHMADLYFGQDYGKIPQFAEVAVESPIFYDLPDQLVANLKSSVTTQIFNPDDYLFNTNQNLNGVYMILRGKVMENDGKSEIYHEMGSLVGV